MSIGEGLKIPLGKTNITFDGCTSNLDLQPGTGSWDILTFIA
jgi:hypothetical protein